MHQGTGRRDVLSSIGIEQMGEAWLATLPAQPGVVTERPAFGPDDVHQTSNIPHLSLRNSPDSLRILVPFLLWAGLIGRVRYALYSVKLRCEDRGGGVLSALRLCGGSSLGSGLKGAIDVAAPL